MSPSGGFCAPSYLHDVNVLHDGRRRNDVGDERGIGGYGQKLGR